MKIIHTLASGVIALVIVVAGLALLTPVVFAGRLLPGVSIGTLSFNSLDRSAAASTLRQYESGLVSQNVSLELRGQPATHTLRELGVGVDIDKTLNQLFAIQAIHIALGQAQGRPQLKFDESRLQQTLAHTYSEQITPPANASLSLASSDLTLVPSRDGEGVDLNQLKQNLNQAIEFGNLYTPIKLSVTKIPAQVQDYEVAAALTFAEELLSEGIQLEFKEDTYHIRPATVRRLLTFIAQVDPVDPTNHILGVKFDSDGLANYLQQTIAPLIDQDSKNARFSLDNSVGTLKVDQFSLPQDGQQLNLPRTASHLAAQLARGQRVVPLAVDVTKPAITDTADIDELGLTSLLATGVSDFAGSPNNRVVNIDVGTARYNGVLIPAGEVFSFNEFLGPVDAAAGYLPELVIKNNATIPEYGGGLCQVSTTVFRAALNAGMAIVDRRNHAYAVSYYGDPGLDATIYPPYTDFQFLNNTPSYILIQSRIEGTKLIFEFWGTDDGREVVVATPVSYDRQPDGAVKAYVEQLVTKDGEVIVDDKFYSRYKSPDLFPKVLSANAEAPSQPNPTPPPKP